MIKTDIKSNGWNNFLLTLHDFALLFAVYSSKK